MEKPKNLYVMTHGHELKVGEMPVGGGKGQKGRNGRKNGITVIV